MADVMERWMRESINALEVMEARLGEHEQAVDAAMAAIRRHTEEIEGLETHIKILREALANAIESVPANPTAELERPRVVAQPPVPPPAGQPMLRPVPPPAQPPGHMRAG